MYRTARCQNMECDAQGMDGQEPVAEEDNKRPQFGNRFLVDRNSIFNHNSWDNVEWDESQEAEAQQKVAANSAIPVSDDQREQYDTNACKYWDSFYSQHQNKFFKDRQWLFTEFPELLPGSVNVEINSSEKHITDKIKQIPEYPGSQASRRVFEIGCGAGNTIFPLLDANKDPELFVYGCDFSTKAVDIVKSNPEYDPSRCFTFVCDVTEKAWSVPFPINSLDVVIMIFVLSAIDPTKMQQIVVNIARYLKPDGLLLFRDYGKYDMAQLRFKPGHCLSENFYFRGDGTRAYFFTEDELREMFMAAGLLEEKTLVDRRLQVNRGKLLKMYRVWIQCKYRKAKCE